MNLTEMRSLLAKRDIQLTRSLGQNFLHDGNQLRRIVDAANILPTDKILEIGPGLGPLTELLLEKANEVLAVKMGARLVEALCERFGLTTQSDELPAFTPGERVGARADVSTAGKMLPQNLFLLHEDALKFLKREQRDGSD